MTDELMNRFNLLNESKISHTKLQMRNKNQMMARVQRKEDCIYNNSIEQEKVKIMNKILQENEPDHKVKAFGFSTQLVEEVFNPVRKETRFLIGKRGNR